MEYSYKNHFQFGWGNKSFNIKDKNGNYWVKFGKVEYIPSSFKKECIRAARLINENKKNPIMICLSGGIDSEVIARSFLSAKVKFSAAILKINYNGIQNVNSYDNSYAIKFCKDNNIKYHEIVLNYEEISSGDYFLTECKKYNTNEPGMHLHSFLVDQLSQNYHCVLGGGDLKLQRHRFNGRPQLKGLFIEEAEHSIAAIEHAYPNSITNRFFMYTPELMLSWLLHPDVKHWIKYEYGLSSEFNTINYHGIKAFVLYKLWPELEPRPKYSGVDKIKNHLREENIDFKSIDLEKNKIIIDYEDLIKMLCP